MKIKDKPTVADLAKAAAMLGTHHRGRVAMRETLRLLNSSVMGLDIPNRIAFLTLLNGALDEFSGTAPKLMHESIESEGTNLSV